MTALIILDTDDAGRMSHLHQAAFAEAEYWDMAAMNGLMTLESVHAYGVESDIGLKGMIMVQRAVDTADILTLATAPHFRRQGLAQTLLNAAIARLGQYGVAKIVLDVAANNRGAIAFYEQSGFREDGRRKGYYKKGRETAIDAILMSRRIAGQG